MLDINGIEIKVGDTVRTTQPSGGILNPAPAQIGTVVLYNVSYAPDPVLAIVYGSSYNRKPVF